MRNDMTTWEMQRPALVFRVPVFHMPLPSRPKLPTHHHSPSPPRSSFRSGSVYPLRRAPQTTSLNLSLGLSVLKM